MELPKTLIDKVTQAELVASTYNNRQSIRLKVNILPEKLQEIVPAGTDWVYVRPEPVFNYQAPSFFKPTHHKFTHIGAHLFLRDHWARYKRVDNYLKDVFFFKANQPENKSENHAKTNESVVNKRTQGRQKGTTILHSKVLTR